MPMNEMDRATSRGGEFRLALGAWTGFGAAYTLLMFLVTFYLPEREPWRTVWMVGGMALGLAAFAVALLAWIAACRRRSPDREKFRVFLREMKTPGHILLAAWFVWACFACLLATREGLASLRHNSTYLFDLAVSLLVLFPLGYYYGRRRDLRLLHGLMDAAACLLAVLILYSFRVFFLPEENPWEGVTILFLGRTINYCLSRLAMASNPNTTGAYCAFFLLLAVYRFVSIKNRAGKLLYGLFFTALAVMLWKSGSRTSLISVAAGTVFLLGGAALRRAKLQNTRGLRILLILAGAAFAAVVILFLKDGTLSAPFRAVTAAAAWLFRNDYRAVTSITLGDRTPIWDAVISALHQDRHLLVHGCSPASVIGTVQSFFGEPYYTHNQFLEILLGQGLPAVTLFGLWLVWLGRRIYGLFSRGSDSFAGWHWILGVLLLSLLVGNMAEAMLTCLQHYLGSLFFLMAGCAGGLSAGEKT